MKKSPVPSSRKKLFDTSYARYSAIAFQLIAVISLGFFFGYLLDNLFKLSFPVFKLILSFSSVIIALYFVIREVSDKE